MRANVNIPPVPSLSRLIPPTPPHAIATLLLLGTRHRINHTYLGKATPAMRTQRDPNSPCQNKNHVKSKSTPPPPPLSWRICSLQTTIVQQQPWNIRASQPEALLPTRGSDRYDSEQSAVPAREGQTERAARRTTAAKFTSGGEDVPVPKRVRYNKSMRRFRRTHYSLHLSGTTVVPSKKGTQPTGFRGRVAVKNEKRGYSYILYYS